MFENARMYDPALGRFAQADSIIPPGVQGLDRYAYVNNSPMNYVDPSGHEPGNHCDRGYCDEDVNVIMANPLMGCRLDCSLDDLDGANMQDRLDWFRWATNHMDENLKAGTSEWFNNIDSIVDVFVLSGQDDNQWILTVDANILIAVKDGYVAFLNKEEVGGAAALWKTFFFELDQGIMSEDGLIGLWGPAEQAGTEEGIARAYLLGYGGGDWGMLNWINTDFGRDDIVFLGIGNLYRGAGTTYCTVVSTCVGGFFDPRKTEGGVSPVWNFAHGIYYFDYLGYSITGH